jgi:hypothetical protein
MQNTAKGVSILKMFCKHILRDFAFLTGLRGLFVGDKFTVGYCRNMHVTKMVGK